MIIFIGIGLGIDQQQGFGVSIPPVANTLIWGVGNNLQWGGVDLQWGF